MLDNEKEPYRVDSREGRFEVVNEPGRVVMVCNEQGSATEYAVLLNEAYRQGYKAGYRDAKGA